MMPTAQSHIDMKKDFVRPAEIPFPADNPYSVTKAALGQKLFFDPRLSGSNWISCSTCHNPGFSWGDGMAHAIGNGMKTLGRRTPTILNLAWAELLMWDGRKHGLEEQALGPMTAPAEMNADLALLVDKLNTIPGYRADFATVFGDKGISGKTIGQAIATYERTIVSGEAPFDRWIAGDEKAISEPAKQGFTLFTGKANCVACHSGWDFSDHGFHDIGLPDKDVGRAEWLKLTSMEHAFKTPTLRDTDRRAPYMHDGSMATLADVIEHYNRGGAQRPSLSDEMHPLHLTAAEKQLLLAFLETLTAPNPPITVPVLYPGAQAATQ
jgi:cytochrome c peroxidase